MRVDTTVVETNIHYPTDASLLGDGVRVLTRTMKKITKLAGAVGAVLRDRSRSTQRCLIQIGRAARSRSDQGKQRHAAVLPQAVGNQPAESPGKPSASPRRWPRAASARSICCNR